MPPGREVLTRIRSRRDREEKSVEKCNSIIAIKIKICKIFVKKWLIIAKSPDLRAYRQDFKLNLLPIYYF